MTRKISDTRRRRRPLGLLLPLLLGLQPALAQEAGWAPTATHAFIPTLLQTPARSGSATARLQSALRGASRAAVPLADDDRRPIRVVISLRPRDEAGLDRLLTGGAGRRPLPALSRAELLRRHAPGQAQVDAVVDHLKAAGFGDISVAPNRLLIEAAGPAVAVRKAFHTGLQRFSFQGREVITNTDDALVPAALADTVQAVVGLQTAVQAHTLHRIHVPGATPAAASGSVLPHQTTDFPEIYQAAGLAPGTDTTVAIITAYDLQDTLDNLKRFAADHRLAPPAVQVVRTGSGRYRADDEATGEWSLDSQTILGVSGGVARLQLFNAPDLSDAELLKTYNAAVDDGAARVVNVSLGLDEAVTHADGSQAGEDAIFKLAAAQGQTFAVASGDEGVYEAEGGYIRYIDDPAAYSVSDPASSPWVLAVGGTELATDGSRRYAGETVWNEGLDRKGRLWASGGGISRYEPAPPWQAALPGTVSGSGRRVLPDVSFDASGASGAKVYLGGTYYTIGGTSLSAPIFAGLWARLQSAHGNRLGFAASELYPRVQANPAVLHDVTAGNNGYNGYGYPAGPGWDYPTGWGSFDTAAVSGLLQAAR